MSQRTRRVIKNDSKLELVKNDSKLGFNPLFNSSYSLRVLRHGTLGTKIMLGLYYIDNAMLNNLKDLGHIQQDVHSSAQKLVDKGMISRDGIRYRLTKAGRQEIEPLIDFFRTAVPVS